VKTKIAVAHAAPVFLDLERTIEKACSIITEAASSGAQLVAFPEAFVPAFPVWSALRSPIYNHDLFCQLAANSIEVPGPHLQRICELARARQILVSLGFNERSQSSRGCIYNSNVLVGLDGSILNHHRKIMPTFYEKLTWAQGDGAGLRVCDTGCGRVGMLICGENTNPLARFSLISQAEEIHIATYPPIWPTHDPGERPAYDLAKAIQLRAAAHSFEGKLFTAVSAGFVDKPAREFLSNLDPQAARILAGSPASVSLVVGPNGQPVSDLLSDDEGILFAEVDLDDCVEPKQFHDIAGGYNRFDIFQLEVDRTARRPVTFWADDELLDDEPGLNELD